MITDMLEQPGTRAMVDDLYVDVDGRNDEESNYGGYSDPDFCRYQRFDLPQTAHPCFGKNGS